jgi:predicted RNA-binding protein associated with RNAse of E/G family
VRFEYRRPGKATETFEQILVVEEPGYKVMLLERHAGEAITIAGEPALDCGAPAVWFVFPGAWHDVGLFHRADGTATGWYTNICTPVQMVGDRWSSTDLFLDHWLSRAGTDAWLDEDELEEAAATKLIGPDTYASVLRERDAITNLVRQRDWPPPEVRQMDLERALSLCD